MAYDSEDNLHRKTLLVTGEVTGYDYDYLGRLTQVVLDYQGSSPKIVDYTLDASGRRIAKAVDGVIEEKYLYNGFLHPSVVTDGNDTPKAFFMGNIMIKVNSGADNGTYRPVRDYLGSVRAVIDIDTGDIAQHLEYDSYGIVLTDTNEGFQPFGYAGGIYDHDTGLTKFGFRDYDPVVGRWTTKDPIGLSGGLNVYEYGMSNPVLYTDLLGLFVVGGEVIIGAGGGFQFHMDSDGFGYNIRGGFGGAVGAELDPWGSRDPRMDGKSTIWNAQYGISLLSLQKQIIEKEDCEYDDPIFDFKERPKTNLYNWWESAKKRKFEVGGDASITWQHQKHYDVNWYDIYRSGADSVLYTIDQTGLLIENAYDETSDFVSDYWDYWTE